MEHLLSNKERERTLLGYFKEKKLSGTKKWERKNYGSRNCVCGIFEEKEKEKSFVTDWCPSWLRSRGWQQLQQSNSCNRACNSCNRAASPGCAVERRAVMLVVKISGVRPSFIWRWTLLRASSSWTIQVSRYFINATVEGQWGLENKLYLSF